MYTYRIATHCQQSASHGSTCITLIIHIAKLSIVSQNMYFYLSYPLTVADVYDIMKYICTTLSERVVEMSVVSEKGKIL